MSPPNAPAEEPPREKEAFDLTPEEEDELERRLADSLEAEQKGELIPWEALFPRPRLTG